MWILYFDSVYKMYKHINVPIGSKRWSNDEEPMSPGRCRHFTAGIPRKLLSNWIHVWVESSSQKQETDSRFQLTNLSKCYVHSVRVSIDNHFRIATAIIWQYKSSFMSVFRDDVFVCSHKALPAYNPQTIVNQFWCYGNIQTEFNAVNGNNA